MTTTRKQCIFCEATTLTDLLSDEMVVPQSHVLNDTRGERAAWMPYNVQRCEVCRTLQNKYLADIDVLYCKNHVAPMGAMRMGMDAAFADMIRANTGVDGILEIGGGNGSLVDALSGTHRYHVVDPAYTGSREGCAAVIDGYIEDVDIGAVDANTVVMSHVFEHLYEPMNVLRKLTDAIRYVYICHPDFDSYTEVHPYTYNILHCEHTFFVDNDFIVALMERSGYRMTDRRSHAGYAVMFHFERRADSSPGGGRLGAVAMNAKTTRNFENYRADMQTKVDAVNAIIRDATMPVYIWPCSVHTISLFNHGLHYAKLAGVLDNAPSKTGKYMYGFDIRCLPMDGVEEGIVILNGGVYNKDIDIERAASPRVHYVVVPASESC
jgi:hypothetical protein